MVAFYTTHLRGTPENIIQLDSIHEKQGLSTTAGFYKEEIACMHHSTPQTVKHNSQS